MKKLLLLLVVCIGFSGCLANKKIHQVESDARIEKEQGGVAVVCEYLNEEQLQKRHGIENNPYIDKAFAITPVYSLVFEVEIKNNTGMMIKYDSREVDLFFGEKSSRPASLDDMEDKINEDSEVKGAVKLNQLRTARSTMYKNIVRIAPGESYKHYVVFINNFRARGDVILDMPLLYQNGNVAEEFEFTYNMVKKSKKNKGK